MIYIEPLEARIAPAVLVVTNTNDSGAGSFRQAILDANSDVDLDVVNFNIPGAPSLAKRIELASPLPIITQSLLIDGYTQPGSSFNSAEVGTNAQLRIEIDGSNFDLAQSNGLHIDSDAVTIRGLAIFGFREINDLGGAGIYIEDGTGISIVGCFLGTDASGKEGTGNDLGGVRVSSQANAVSIGAAGVFNRNLISNNLSSGIIAEGSNLNIVNNVIGAGVDGLSPLPNRGAGIEIENLADAVIGGNDASKRNTIAHNFNEGILLRTGTSGVDIQQNSFFRNGELAIDIGGTGVTLNDPLDVDAGPNGMQNMPEITGVVNGGLTTVQFRLESSPNTSFRVDFYSTTNVDPTGYGEGREFIGSASGMTDVNGLLISESLFLDGFAPGTTITATATNNATNQTSEFSRGFNVNAVSFPNDTTATWLDGDGDAVTLKITKGTLDTSQFFFGPGNVQGSNVLQLLQLKGAEYNGTNVTVTVKKSNIGDGRVSIGYIDAFNTDLGIVSIPGDLGRIVCGDSDSTTSSLKTLKVKSMGVAGAFTLPDGIGSSTIRGPVGSFAVAGDLYGVTLNVDPILPFDPQEVARTVIKSFTVGGNVTGTTLSTVIRVDGHVNTLSIRGLLSGPGDGLTVTKTVGKVTLGSVLDASVTLGDFNLAPNAKGALVVKGDVMGARISVSDTVENVTILGSLIGTRSGTGSISAQASLNSVTVRGDVVATRPATDTLVTGSGTINVSGSINKILIGGSVRVDDVSVGSLIFCGRISASDTLGSVTIGGSTIGTPESPVTISAIGNAVKPTTGFDVAIRSVLIKGSAVNTNILAGIAGDTPLNADASIGSVAVKKDWVASSIAAGVEDTGAIGYGAGDVLQNVDDTALVARIASITINGAFLPGLNPLMSYGFAAEEITKGKIGGARLPLDPGPSNDSGNQWAYLNLGFVEVQ